MIDLVQLRKNPEYVTKLVEQKDPSYSVQALIALDKKVHSVRQEVESLQAQKNVLAQQGKHGVTQEMREKANELSILLQEKNKEFEGVQKAFLDHYLRCPNIPDEALPCGGKEANQVIKVVGKKPEFNFPIKNHVELGTQLQWFDFDQGARIAASNFPVYKEPAIRLMYALQMFMISNNKKHGFTPILPPSLVNEKSLEVASNFPKFRDQVYHISEDNLFLIPTSEVSLTNLYRDHIFATTDLPVRLTAFTSCFRREAGGYGSSERGLIRIHQFEKAELYTLCTAENSAKEHERMLACAEDILQQLGLHYRVSLLAMQDCSFASAKTYDIEVWLPGQNAYMEVSSCSNCKDFQARRGMIRHRSNSEQKPELVHTLNSSSLAIPRLMVALMESGQRPDGSIVLPDVLSRYIC